MKKVSFISIIVIVCFFSSCKKEKDYKCNCEIGPSPNSPSMAPLRYESTIFHTNRVQAKKQCHNLALERTTSAAESATCKLK